MIWTKINKNKIGLSLMFSFLILCYGSLQAEAKADFSDYETVRHPLIQVTDVQDEYEALFRLGLLSTSEWESASSFFGEDTSEYGRFMEQLRRESAYEKARASIVQIQLGGYYGSGVLWDIREGNLVIVSNAHLLKEGERGEVIFRTGVHAEGTVACVSDEKDIGFMTIPLEKLEREDWFFMRFAGRNVQNYQELSGGEALFVIGSASGTGEDYYEGTVGDTMVYFPEFQTKMLYGYCKAVPGMSGGGTFDEKGNFLGMLTAGTKQGEIASLPLEIMMEEYDRLWEAP